MWPNLREIAFSINTIQFYAALTGVISVFLTAKKNSLCWPIGILSSSLAFYIYLFQELPFEGFLQAIYIGMGFYGWINWRKSKNNYKFGVEKTTINEHRWLIGLSIGIGLILGVISYSYYGNFISFLDALLTTFSLAANWLAAKRKIENWWYWIVIDLVSVGLYAYKEMYWFALLFGFFVLIAIRGLYSWKEELEV
jgi:nicotinamide mononucleotide transporter